MGNANSGRLISIELVQRVERLLGYMSQGAVALEAGIDLGTVQKIGRGDHPHQKALRCAVRCPGCGGKLLTAHCLKCQLDGNPAGLAAPLRVVGAGESSPEKSPDKPGARAA